MIETPHPWSIEARADVPGARIELRRYDLPRPSVMCELEQAPVMSAVLPRPGGSRGQVRFELGRSSHYQDVGNLLLRPAGIRVHSVGNGGIISILTCTFDPLLFRDVTGIDDWDTERLRRCASLDSYPLLMTMRQLLNETVHPGFAGPIAIEALVRLVLVEVARAIGPAGPAQRAKGGLAQWQLARIEGELHEVDGHWPSVGELAAICGIGRSHLSRAFVATTGTTLAAYANMLRFERAKMLILAGQMSMQQVAASLGFATPSSFAAAFRRHTGVTPLSFSQQFASRHRRPGL